VPKAPKPKEIRQAYSDYSSDWKDTIEEGKTDMRYVAGDPWEPADRKAREEAGRPCISLDEINQYVNQTINNIRENKRGIKVIPKGDGSNDQDAERRANIIRGIENRSKAQQAYITAFENACQRSYGFAGLTTDYIEGKSFDQEIRIRRFANPDAVLITSQYKEADASDIDEAFVTDLIRKSQFKKKYGAKAKIQSFTGEHMIEAPGWIRENYVQTAEFWKAHKTYRKLLLIDGGEQGPIEEWGDELNGRTQGLTIIRDRQVESAEVVQYITNGLEILEENKWQGSRIPICACFGKEIWIDDGSGSKRVLLSMVRLARDPQMLLAYLATQECEEAGMTPKAPFIGYKGQFESDAEAWEYLTKIPRAKVEVDIVIDGANGTVLPLPTRPNFVPNFEAYELAKDSARRSVQSSMGISGLPTAAQRDSEKSGIALEKIQTQEAIGSFHFTDNYDGFIENVGWQANELVPVIYDTARTVPVLKKDGTHSIMRINDQPYSVQNPKEEHLQILDEDGEPVGEYGTAISTQPNYKSQRDEASSFVDLLLQNLQQLPVPPNVAQQILALAIRLKDIGPIGEKIAELLTPPNPDQIPPQAQAAIAQAQGMVQQLQQELAKLTMERDAKVLDHKARLELEQMKQQTERVKLNLEFALQKLKIEADLAKAEVGTKAQVESERQATVKDVYLATHEAAHDVAKTGMEHEHEENMADKQAATAQAQQATQIQADQASAEANQGAD
jgi:hypothetical protein